MVNPWLFGAGAFLVSVPIIIHLLNKRKFKTVQWAAMDFLIEADKLNRRRVRLEELLLLLLRCLAILLIGLLLARPFMSQTAGLFGAPSYDRVIVFDDSLSMDARSGGTTPLDKAKKHVSDLVGQLSTERTGDTVTIRLLSQPNTPLFNVQPVKGDGATRILEVLKDITTSDLQGDFDTALMEVEKSMADEESGLNRMVYILTDLRKKDWLNGEVNQQGGSVLEPLRRVADKAAGCFVVDLGSEEISNLSVESIQPQDKTLIAGVPTRFDVTVRNHGARSVKDIKVRFVANASLPLEATIDSIPAGGTNSIPFTFSYGDGQEGDQREQHASVPITVEIEPADGAAVDVLPGDNTRYFPGRITSGIRTLLVDGDPSPDYGRSESFFLRRALSPRGRLASGVDVEVVDDTAFAAEPLDEFQQIYLCNVYRLSEDLLAKLEKWVTSGGGLVIALGDQVDEEYYNRNLYRDGSGLLPVRLEGVAGDSKRDAWTRLNLTVANHPALRVFEGENTVLLEGIKIFRWWNATLPEEVPAATRVLATLADQDGAPAIIESRFGDGQVIALVSPLDLDWSNWPQDPASYLILNQELVRHYARDESGEGLIKVGASIHWPLNLTRYKIDAKIKLPNGDVKGIQAKPAATGDVNDAETTWLLNVADIEARGVYEIELSPTDESEVERIPFAANIDPSESELVRADDKEFVQALGDSPVQIVKNTVLAGLEGAGARSEMWKTILILLLIVLCGEQVFGWWLGKKRTI
jgi:hypothetical protein